MTFFEPLIDLLLPSSCAECSLPPSVYCRTCLGRHLARKVERQYSSESFGSVQMLSGLALSILDSAVSRAMTEFKEKNQFAVVKSMVDSLLPVSSPWSADLVIAAPSDQRNFRRRGFVPAELVAERVARRWRFRHLRSGLSFVRAVDDQAALSVELRHKNLVESMRASPRVRGRNVLLVDDIVTTGSTLFEGARAVAEAGGRVVGFVALAETLRRQPHPAGFQVVPGGSPKID